MEDPGVAPRLRRRFRRVHRGADEVVDLPPGVLGRAGTRGLRVGGQDGHRHVPAPVDLVVLLDRTSTATASGGYSAVTSGTGRGAQVVAAAASQTGKPYRFGAAGPNAFDCSGLTQYAFKSVGISLPHSANSQKSYGTAVSAANALPGDLIIFLSGGNGYHAAIYAGGGYMYDAPNSGGTVGKRKIYSGTVIFRRLV